MNTWILRNWKGKTAARVLVPSYTYTLEQWEFQVCSVLPHVNGTFFKAIFKWIASVMLCLILCAHSFSNPYSEVLSSSCVPLALSVFSYVSWHILIFCGLVFLVSFFHIKTLKTFSSYWPHFIHFFLPPVCLILTEFSPKFWEFIWGFTFFFPFYIGEKISKTSNSENLQFLTKPYSSWVMELHLEILATPPLFYCTLFYFLEWHICYPPCMSCLVPLLKGVVILNVDKNHSNINANEVFPQKVAQ